MDDSFDDEEFEVEEDADTRIETAENFMDNTEFQISENDFVIDTQPASSSHDQDDHDEPPPSAAHLAKMAEAEASTSDDHHHYDHYNNGPSDLIELEPVEKKVEEYNKQEKQEIKEEEKKINTKLVKTRNYQAHEKTCCACDDCCGCNIFYFC